MLVIFKFIFNFPILTSSFSLSRTLVLLTSLKVHLGSNLGWTVFRGCKSAAIQIKIVEHKFPVTDRVCYVLKSRSTELVCV